MRRIAVLRPPERAAATLARIAAAGGEGVAVPLFRLAPLPWRAPAGDYEALVLTSANAVRLAGALPALPTWTVGLATADAARAAGLTVAHVGAAGAEALFAALRAAGVRRALWLAGEDRATDPPPGVEVVTVYRAEPLADVDIAAIAGGIALAHSPRAAARLAELLGPDDRARSALVAISRRAADAAGEGWESIAVAATPDDAAMVAAAIDRARDGSDKRPR